MARGFRRRGRGEGLRYAARLDPYERSLLVGLLDQVRDLLGGDEVSTATATAAAAAADPADAASAQSSADAAFDDIVAGLGDLGAVVPEPAPDARSFGDRDPALQRLLPAGNRADDQAAAEFRRLTEAGLRRRKVDTLGRAIAALQGEGDAVELDARTAEAMVVALTDVRLVIGERLGLRDDADVERLEEVVAELDPDEPLARAAAVYDFLTWLQETLAHALIPGRGGHRFADG
ncbi:MAG TPA: DUF2017 family protein [Dermatophilaceae bacterium]|nr:DUF2017 family protein [Dermatophilaceae bacterium]